VAVEGEAVEQVVAVEGEAVVEERESSRACEARAAISRATVLPHPVGACISACCRPSALPPVVAPTAARPTRSITAICPAYMRRPAPPLSLPNMRIGTPPTMRVTTSACCVAAVGGREAWCMLVAEREEWQQALAFLEDIGRWHFFLARVALLPTSVRAAEHARWG
jgi:hypothetical protein